MPGNAVNTSFVTRIQAPEKFRPLHGETAAFNEWIIQLLLSNRLHFFLRQNDQRRGEDGNGFL